MTRCFCCLAIRKPCGAIPLSGGMAAPKTATGVIEDHVIPRRRFFGKRSGYTLRSRGVDDSRVVPSGGPAGTGGGARVFCPGSAKASAVFPFPKDGYDLTVDTQSMTAADSAERIYAHCSRRMAIWKHTLSIQYKTVSRHIADMKSIVDGLLC